MPDILTCELWSVKVFGIINLGSQIDLRWSKLKGTPLNKPIRVFSGSIIWQMKILPQNGHHLLLLAQIYGCWRQKLLLFAFLYLPLGSEWIFSDVDFTLLLPSFANIWNPAFSAFRYGLMTAGFPRILLFFSFQVSGLNNYWVTQALYQ